MNRRVLFGLAGLVLGAGYSAQGCSNSCPNCPGAPAQVVISPGSASVLPGDSLTLAAEVLDANGQLLAGHPVQWQSLDPAVATINDTGNAKGLTVGTARIVATMGGLADTAPFLVVTTSTFSEQVYPILLTTCGLGGCHVTSTPLTPAPPPTMNAAPATLYAQLTLPANGFVTGGDTTVGLMLSHTRLGATDPMPPGQPLSTLSPAAYHLLVTWIAQGALNN